MTEHEELLKLRALVQQQQMELAQHQQVIETKNQLIETKDQLIETKDKMIAKLNIQVENMIQALLHARKKLFGVSTEVTKAVDGQLSLFETAQELARELADEQKKITIPAYTRKARQPGVRAEMLSGLVQEIEEYIIPETDTCTKCGSALKVIGKRVVRTEVEFIPAKIKVKQIVQQVAKCVNCGTKDSEKDSCHFQKAAVPAPPLVHSLSTPSLIAQVMYQKFVMGMPFARQEKDWYRMGLYLPRADMANWTIRCCEEWLLPIYNRIHEILVECHVLHMDELCSATHNSSYVVS